jgi:hypothetical protein
MKGILRQSVEIEVSDSEIFEAFIRLLKRKLPVELRQYCRVFIDKNEVCFIEEVCGHNRDWETGKVSDEHPKLKISKKQMIIIGLIDKIIEQRNSLIFGKEDE